MKKMLLGTLIVTAFLAYALPPYLTGGSRVPLDGQPGWYYGLLVGHILLGAVAMIAGLIQFGRRWRPLRRMHVYSGRVYAACMIPAGLMAIAIGSVTPFGPIVAASDVLLGVSMLACTVLGIRAILAGDVPAHRRWMIRSGALTYSVIVNRVLGPVVFVITDAITHDERVTATVGMTVTAWLSWTATLAIVETVRRRRDRPAPRPARSASAAPARA